ncbi:type II toxin-antitoxin system VapC family toxin [Candidatus Woesearchaeota archaeon]|nr:type II toxin-antitoxin system VapC family toxin [Candidatus Woesearchaeota archaeon]
MTEEINFFYDTYALLEIIKGNNSYNKYIKNIGIVTTRLNLMELFHRLYILHGIGIAEFYYQEYLPFAVGISDSLIKKAAIFRAENKKKDLSYIDCIGSIFAKENKIKFLTGDIQFKDMDNVEFVK